MRLETAVAVVTPSAVMTTTTTTTTTTGKNKVYYRSWEQEKEEEHPETSNKEHQSKSRPYRRLLRQTQNNPLWEGSVERFARLRC